jgi:hypothetical protein
VKKSKRVIILSDERRLNKSKKVLIDTDPRNSTHSGLKGIYETLLRRFKTLMYLITLIPLYLLAGLLLGAALTPSLYALQWAWQISQNWSLGSKAFLMGTFLGMGFFVFGLTLVILVPLVNFVLRAKPQLFRGPYYSVDVLKWVVHNSLTYLVRYTFLEFITPTPFNILFFKLMGMKIGKATQINTSNISDPALIELGNYVTVGGSATLCAHYGQSGFLVLAPIKIGDKVTIGLKSSIMGGVTIGEGAKILPHSIVLPKTVIPAGETWGGVPAQKIILKKSA